MAEDWLESAWEIREEQVYPSLFGQNADGIYTVDATTFVPFNVESLDPRWLFHGVMKFGPTQERQSWIYVSSGLSNAWADEDPNPDGPSGLGCELVFETTENAEWAVLLSQRLLAFQILLGWDQIKDRGPLEIGDRIPLRASIDGRTSLLNWGLITQSRSYEPRFVLPTGYVELLHIVGVTEDEATYARENGFESLLNLLDGRGYPITDPTRRSILNPG